MSQKYDPPVGSHHWLSPGHYLLLFSVEPIGEKGRCNAPVTRNDKTVLSSLYTGTWEPVKGTQGGRAGLALFSLWFLMRHAFISRQAT